MKVSSKANISTPKLFERITKLLDSQDVLYRIVIHKPINGSVLGSSVITGTNPKEAAKSLVMIVDGIKPIMVVLRGSDRVNKKNIKKLTESGDVRLATPEEVQRTTQTEIGTLPPIGDLFKLTTYVDYRLLKEKQIAFSTGLRTKTIVIDSSKFKKIINPIVGDFVEN
jgi:prolyl-tRNA editing enzyme YbaK/EbsC (Cys-tRNA(Pro) deacylase)